MASGPVTGFDWRDDELDAIVADYFAMLSDELRRTPYVKRQHNRDLQDEIGRSPGSIEFKHQNISAVLIELGHPWISGYKPMRNYQHAIIGAVERYLTANPAALDVPLSDQPATGLNDDVFVPPPAFAPDAATPEPLRRLVQKFDPVARDYRNRALGRAGEKFVLDIERESLDRARRPDLARNVRWISDDEGDGAGYDILSFAPDGRTRLLEVKTTNGGPRIPFFLTRNENAVAAERPTEWKVYRVHAFATAPQIFALSPPLDQVARVSPESWRVSF